MRRLNVREFIKADPVKLVLSRKSDPVKTAAGGFVSGEALPPLDPQTFRIVQNKRRYTAGIVNSEMGDIPHTDYLLIGGHRSDAQVDDTFMWRGENYRITGVHEQRTESFLASIDLLGPGNQNA